VSAPAYPKLPAASPSYDFTIYERATGRIVMAGNNKALCVEADCPSDCAILYQHSVPLMHYVDVLARPPVIRVKPEFGG
jgi:hypothetical protein